MTAANAAAVDDDACELSCELVSTAVRDSTLLVGYAGAGGATSIGSVPLSMLDARPLPVGAMLNTVGKPGVNVLAQAMAAARGTGDAGQFFGIHRCSHS